MTVALGFPPDSATLARATGMRVRSIVALGPSRAPREPAEIESAMARRGH